MMTETQFSWNTNDNLKIYAKEWKVADPKGVICIVHGLGEHCNRYNHVAKFFTDSGFSCLGYDRRGHGQSEGKRGHSPSLSAYLDEIGKLVVTAVERYEGKPIILYGHSMGGNLVLNYVLRRNPKIQGVISTGAWIQLPEDKVPSPFLMFFAKIMNFISPSLQQPNDLDPNDVSRSKEVVKAYVDDPLVHDKISMRAALEMVGAASYLDTYEGSIAIPSLIMHGSVDRLTSVNGSKEFAKRVNGDVEYKEWEGYYHEIHNEPTNQEVFDFTLKWILQKI